MRLHTLHRLLITLAMLCFAIGSQAKAVRTQDKQLNKALQNVFAQFREAHLPALAFGNFKVENFSVNKEDTTLELSISRSLLHINMRESDVKWLEDSIKANLPAIFSGYNVKLYCGSNALRTYIPNIYRSTTDIDTARLQHHINAMSGIVRNADRPVSFDNGMDGRHIAMWPSHGYYFEPSTNLWQLQRPRLFEIAEDTYTLSIVYPYLVPMLEKAGANVFIPRERDIQTAEIIIDYDTRTTTNYVEKNARKGLWRAASSFSVDDTVGYAMLKQVYRHGENPFEAGSYRVVKSRKNGVHHTDYVPDFPHDGEYAVYVSYKSLEHSVSDAHYTVYHTGGTTEYIVDQTMGGGTWIYLGTHHFRRGQSDACKVRLSNKSLDNGKLVTADAVRFGGGMGCVERGVNLKDSTLSVHYFTSEKPKYLEGSRYWLQMAGFGDSVYAAQDNEYKTDYMSRALWVNALMGGSHLLPNVKGKRVPIDLAFALHTDAGIDTTIVGTLGICLTNDSGEKKYPDGTSRMSSRDLTDIVETQVLSDIRRCYNPNWTNRGIKDEAYYEARIPKTPTMLLELLSHQNFADMEFAHDPAFKMLVARSIYKGIAKFFAAQTDTIATIAPLPPTHFSALLHGENSVRLSWSMQTDSLEPSAVATGYIVYKAIEDNAFDNGVYVSGSDTIIDLDPNTVYRFRVSAVNGGGESFPTEILAACQMSKDLKKSTALIVNGFNRVAPPASFADSLHSGFDVESDPGVPDIVNASKTGDQTDFVIASKYKSNDEPGHGASGRDLEGFAICGNSHNYPYVHGVSMKKAGISFSSISDEAFADSIDINTLHVGFLDYILGLEKRTVVGTQTRYEVLNAPTCAKLTSYLNAKGNLYISGAYMADELYRNGGPAATFANDMLHFNLGKQRITDASQIFASLSLGNDFRSTYSFSQGISANHYPLIYTNTLVNSQDQPGKIIFRFLETGDVAAIGYRGDYKTVSSVIPFEDISTQVERDLFMSELLRYFKLIKSKSKK